jgi:hypothetical protein
VFFYDKEKFIMKIWLVAAFAALLSACGSNSGLDGVYDGSVMGMKAGSIAFQSGSKLVFSGANGIEMECKYEVKDGKVRVQVPYQGTTTTLVMTILEDGSLDADGIIYIKRKK